MNILRSLASRKSCYCAFCKVERKVYSGKHLSVIDILGLVFFGIILTYVVYQHLDPRGLFFVGMLLVVGECFAQMRWRSAMICQNCGFDPVLYIRNPEVAGQNIKAFIEKRQLAPDSILRPPLPASSSKRSHFNGLGEPASGTAAETRNLVAKNKSSPQLLSLKI